MRILLTGATGFAGTHVARFLAARGDFVSCLVRLGSERRLRLPAEGRAERVSGDLADPESLIRKPLGCDAVVHLAAIRREDPRSGQTFERVHVEGVRNLVEACVESEVSRLVHVSILGADAEAPDGLRRSKFRGEEVVRRAPMRWTILRPALLYGPGHPALEWMARLTYGAPLLPVPVPGGRTRLRPLWIGDLAAAIAACLDRPATEGVTFEAPGPEPVTLGAMVEGMARARGFPHWRLPVPPGLLPRVPGTMGFLDRDHAADAGPLARATGVVPTSLEAGMRFFWAARRER